MTLFEFLALFFILGVYFLRLEQVLQIVQDDPDYGLVY